MGNGRFYISKSSDEILTKVMVVLEIERPLALRIALSKGLISGVEYKGKDVLRDERGREIPDRVVWSGFEYTLFCQLIIEKEQRVISDEKEMDDLFRYYIEQGLRIIGDELENLPPTENYLLFLWENNKNIQSDDEEAILSLIGF